MKGQSEVKADDLNGKRRNLTAQESTRQRQREESLDWISTNALTTLRLAWCSQSDDRV